MNRTNNGGSGGRRSERSERSPPPVLYWAILRVVEEGKWKVDLGEDEAEMMEIGLESGAKGGYLGKVILESRCGGKFDEDVMDWAAKNGHLNVIIWLHLNRTEGCSRRAMNDAAKNGHFDVVKWLHENRTEGCSIKAMDGAARNGHLNVV